MPDSTENWSRLKEIVADALDAPADARTTLLHQACAGDAGLLAEAESLVLAYDQSTGVIDRRTDTYLGLGGPDLLSLSGQRVGKYRLVRVIAEGAMAAVYEAQQPDPKRTVALKIFRTNMTLLDAHQRFRREAQALARLQHPNIARIYEASVHQGADGRAMPFIAMEFVDGSTLTQHARERALPRERRIELLIKVAHAVHAAHQQAVIHRDLKPANVLVDKSGEPKVLDFGIARIVGEELETYTWQTTAGVLLGTPGYMSPEQATGRPHEVDVRSDVWALGVMLYELLVDRLPIDVRGASISEVLRRIEQAQPPPISSIDKALKGDLETIVGTALAPDKSQRYASAQALAEDLHRLLRHEPIAARPPTTWYVLGKFARRNRGKIIAAALMLGLLIGGIISSSIGFVRASTERNRAQRINQFLMTMMSTTDPNIGRRDVTVAEALAGSEKAIQQNFGNDPWAEADVRAAIGWIFYNLGHYDEAVIRLRRAVELRTSVAGPAHAKTLDDTNTLVTAIRWQYKPAEALAIVEPAYNLALRTLGERNTTTIGLLDNYAGTLDDLGRINDAEPLYRKAVELNTQVQGPDKRQTLSAMNNHAVVLMAQARWAEAESVLRKVIEIRTRDPEGSRVPLLTNRHNLATIIANQGRFDDAIREFESVIADATEQLGPDHSKTLSARVSYADALIQNGRPEDALTVNRDVLDRRMRLLGQGHEQTMTSQHNTIHALLSTERFAEAERASRALVADADRFSPPDHMLRLVSRQDLAAALAGLKRFAESEPLELELIEAYGKRFGDDHYRTLVVKNNHATTLLDTGRVNESLALLESIAQTLARAPAPLVQVGYERNHSRALVRAGRFEDAQRELLAAYERAKSAGDPRAAHKYAGPLVELYTAWGKPDEAQRWRATTQPTSSAPATQRVD